MDRRSFVQVRVRALAPDEARFIKRIPIEVTRDHVGGEIIARLEPANGHSLRPLFEKLAGDPDMMDRYHMAFDEDTNRINLTFRIREMATYGRMR